MVRVAVYRCPKCRIMLGWAPGEDDITVCPRCAVTTEVIEDIGFVRGIASGDDPNSR